MSVWIASLMEPLSSRVTKQFCDNVVNFECNLHSKRETCVSEVVSLFALFVVLGRRGQIF